MEYLVGAKGQVVIAKGIRDCLGVEPGWIAVQRLVDDHVELHFVPPPHRRSLKGILGPHLKRTVAAGTAWEEETERAWASAVREDDGGGE